MRGFPWSRSQAVDDLSTATRRLRRLHLAQLVALLAGSAAAFVVVLLLLAAIIDGQSQQADVEAAQNRLVEAQRSLDTIAADEVQLRGGLPAWTPTTRGSLAYHDVAADLRLLSEEGYGARGDAGDDSRWITPAAGRVLDSVELLTPLVGPSGTEASSRGSDARRGAGLRTLRSGLDGWVAAFSGSVTDAREEAADATRRLATLCILILSVLAVGGVYLWVQLDRARERTMAGIRSTEERSIALASNSSDLVMVVDGTGQVTYASPSAETLLDTSSEVLVGRSLADLVHPQDRARLAALDASADRRPTSGPIEWRFVRGDGSHAWMETLVSDARDEASVAGWILNSRDIGDRKAAEDELTRQAFRDSLTGLPNRALFADRLRHALAARRGHGHPVAVALMDLDDFKTVNDSLGHAAGDAVLREFGTRIKAALRPEDTVSRLGGDEFALLVQGVDNHEVRLLAERIVQHIAAPIEVEGDRISMQASVGIAFGDDDVLDGDHLLRNADIAMYAAKTSAGNRVELFRPEMQAAAHERLDLKRDLGIAARRGDLRVVFQPIFELGEEAVVGFEALLRWNHPERGPVPPTTFIPLAEETGLIHPLGRWVLREACANAAGWRDHGADVYVAVNVSGAQLDDPELPGYTARVMAETGLSTDGLLIEVTESSLPASPEQAIATLQRFKDLGLRLAIDDFGTGYSSLSYLASLPVDVVKMDKCFVDGLGMPGRQSDLASTILKIGSGLGLRTVAEGIEHPEQAQQLRELGCDLGQGYYYARPLDAAAAAGLVRDEGRRGGPRGAGGEADPSVHGHPLQPGV